MQNSQAMDEEMALRERNVIHPQGEIFPGSPLCFRHLGALSASLPVCTNLEFVVWNPWTNNDCATSLLSATQALYTFVPAFPMQSSTMDPVSWISMVSQPRTPNCREADPTHDWLRNSITVRLTWSKLS